MDMDETTTLFAAVGANVSSFLNENTDYLLVGKEPDNILIGKAIGLGVKIVTEKNIPALLGYNS